MTVPSLYVLCLRALRTLEDATLDLSQVPYDPFIQDILRESTQLPDSILNGIGTDHPDLIRAHHPYVLSLSPLKGIWATHKDQALSDCFKAFPMLVSFLDLSFSPFNDDCMIRLEAFGNLVVLNVEHTNISDTAFINLLSLRRRDALPHLQHVNAANNAYLTDRCLKYVGQLDLQAIDLSFTSVTPSVALSYLRRHGYRVLDTKNESDTSHLGHPLYDYTLHEHYLGRYVPGLVDQWHKDNTRAYLRPRKHWSGGALQFLRDSKVSAAPPVKRLSDAYNEEKMAKARRVIQTQEDQYFAMLKDEFGM
ncbi:hypothetical protein BCR43DRAFT_490771 [Syncephalastrum racemosum]|uniref:Uncharacterized protein n=1 Tax=Syncephalastrum racemosum TaxID=13706 RepID=A0A1X2HGE1_SYNRA|nr:hypothetical protein BCR43DRAFT_490771 [Syncephalastrum racemosum]